MRECGIEREVRHKICINVHAKQNLANPCSNYCQQPTSNSYERQHSYKNAGGVEEAPADRTRQKRMAHEAAAGGVSVMVGTDGFYNAVTTATMTARLNGCGEKHQCQNAMKTHGAEV